MAISRGRDQKAQPKQGSKYGLPGQSSDHERALDWGNISPFKLKLMVAAITAGGDAVTFGTTRQGGLMFGILEADNRYKEYSNDIEDMEAKMASNTDAALASVPQQVRDHIIELCRDV